STAGDTIAVFDALPFEAQLSVLDAWWLNPREPRVTQPFLMKLLGHERPGIRLAAAQSLGQYRAPGTAAALLGLVQKDTEAAPVALRSLLPMADVLTEAQIKTIAGMLPE